MDLSGLIFVALAVAWAAYLIPKALRHHEDVARARTVDEFSDHLRVLARREPVSAKAARLVVSRTRTEAGRTTTAGAAVVETDAPEPAPAPVVPVEPVARAASAASAASDRPARRSAARRRRRVLALLLVLLAATTVGVLTGHVATAWLVAPMVLLVGWLVACRLMVKGERRARPARPVSGQLAPGEDASATDEVEGADSTDEVPAAPQGDAAEETPVAPAAETEEPAPVESADAGLWDPLPMTLPTYVTKSKATRRTVRTIDLDDSDVWTSGRTEVDAALAREADAERPPVAPGQPRETRRAAGS